MPGSKTRSRCAGMWDGTTSSSAPQHPGQQAPGAWKDVDHPTPSSPSANWGRNLPTMRGWRPLWAKSSWPQGLGQGSERPPPPYAAAGNANTQAPSWFHHAEPRGPGSASCSPVPQECPIPQPFPADLNPYHLVSCNAKFRLRKTSRRCQE